MDDLVIPIQIKERKDSHTKYALDLKEKKHLYSTINQKITELEKSSKILIDAKLILPPLLEDKNNSGIPEEWLMLLNRLDRISNYMQHVQKAKQHQNVDDLKARLFTAYSEANQLSDEFKEYKFIMEGIQKKVTDELKHLNVAFLETKDSKNILEVDNHHNAKSKENYRLLYNNALSMHHEYKNNMANEIKTQMAKVENLMKANSIMESQIRQLKSEEEDSLKKLMDSFQKELQQKQSKIEGLINDAKVTATAKQNLEVRNLELESLLQDQQIKSAAQSEKSLSENNLLRQELADLKNDSAYKSQQISVFKKKFEETEKLYLELQNSSKIEIDKLAAQYQAIKRQSESEKGQFNNMTNEVRQLRRQMAELKSQSEALALKDLKKLQDLSGEISRLKESITNNELAHVENVRDTAIQLSNAEKEIKHLVCGSSALNERITHLKLNIASLISDLNDKRFDLEDSNQYINSLSLHLENCFQFLQDELKDNQYLKIQVSLLGMDLKGVQSALISATMEIESLKSRISLDNQKWATQIANESNKSLEYERALKELHSKHSLLCDSNRLMLIELNALKTLLENKLNIIAALEQKLEDEIQENKLLDEKCKETTKNWVKATNLVELKNNAIYDLEKVQKSFNQYYNKNMVEFQRNFANKSSLLDDSLAHSMAIINILENVENLK